MLNSNSKNVIQLLREKNFIDVKATNEEARPRTNHFNINRSDKKFINIGSDPIVILEPKTVRKNFHRRDLNPLRMPVENIQFESPEKLVSDSPPSKTTFDGVGRTCPKSVSSVAVMDHGIQCDQLMELNNNKCNPGGQKSSIPSYNPLTSLQTLVRQLKCFKKILREKNDKNSLSSIIYHLDFAVNMLIQTYPSTSSPLFVSSGSGLIECSDTSSMPSKGEGPDKRFEETCRHLKTSCLKMEESCQRLRKDKDDITKQFMKKSQELETCLKHELELQTKLYLTNKSAEATSKKLDEYVKSVEELSKNVLRLKAKTEKLEGAEKEKAKLVEKLREVCRDKDKLHAEVQMMKLEKEKNTVLLALKEEELVKLRNKPSHIVEKSQEQVNKCGGDYALSTPRTISTCGAVSASDKSAPLQQTEWRLRGNPQGRTRPVNRGNAPHTLTYLKKELQELFKKMKKHTEVVETKTPSPWSSGSYSPSISITTVEK